MFLIFIVFQFITSILLTLSLRKISLRFVLDTVHVLPVISMFLLWLLVVSKNYLVYENMFMTAIVPFTWCRGVTVILLLCAT